MLNRADEIIKMMLDHKGYGYRHISAEVLTEFVRYEWQSNRWVMITETGTENILGWISWYNFDDESLRQIKEYGIIGCFHKDIALYKGDNLYLCNAIVKEGVPGSTFRMLVKMAKDANPESRTISAHLRNRDDPVFRWSSFRLPKQKRLVL